MRALVLTVFACIVASLTAVALMPVNAAQPPATSRISASSAELLVFEAESCIYCFIFRRDVAPGYLKSSRARDVPLRYIDVHRADLARFRLKSPLTTLPTVVLMQNGRERGRITGYAGPEPFFHMVSRLLK